MQFVRVEVVVYFIQKLLNYVILTGCILTSDMSSTSFDRAVQHWQSDGVFDGGAVLPVSRGAVGGWKVSSSGKLFLQNFRYYFYLISFLMFVSIAVCLRWMCRILHPEARWRSRLHGLHPHLQFDQHCRHSRSRQWHHRRILQSLNWIEEHLFEPGVSARFFALGNCYFSFLPAIF